MSNFDSLRTFILAHTLFVILISGSWGDDLQRHEQQRIAAIAQAIPTFVGVFGPGGQGGGSGVVISPNGYALTNYHVVESCDSFMKCGMSDGVLYDAVIVGIDPTGDVALIKLLGRDDFPTATMADSDAVSVGDECFAVGNPFLLATDFQPSVSWGIVSGTHRYQYPAGTLLEYADCLQTDAAINPGNSGGPLFNANGQLIGINGRGSFEKRGRVNVGVGYAISINQIKNFLTHLNSGRIVDHATLGATMKTDENGLVRVAEILESSDAYRRGLDVDDVVVRFAGRAIQTVNQFKNVLGIFPKGWRVPLVYRRDGVESKILVRLTGVHDSQQLIEIVQGSEVPSIEPKSDDSDDSPPPVDESLSNAASKLPAEFASQFVERRGYANFYFNQMQRARIWNGFLKQDDFTKLKPRWRLTGLDTAGQTVTIVLGDEKSGMQVANQTYVLDLNEDLSTQLDPPQSGGMLLALHFWRKLLMGGPSNYGEVIYFGAVPSDSSGAECELLIGTSESTEAHFLFAVDDQRLLGIEMFSDIDSDPCEVRFFDYQLDLESEVSVPGKIQFGPSGQPVESIQIRQIEFLDPTE